jgi:hypothetical protein
MGSNVKSFSLPVDGLQTLADRLGVPPSTAEWCFANRKRISFTSLETSEDEESTDGPVTEREVASMMSVVHVGERDADEMPDGGKVGS